MTELSAWSAGWMVALIRGDGIFSARRFAGSFRIAVHDHIIVGKDGHASLKGLKLI